MKLLVSEGYSAIAFDNLSTGYADSVRYGELIIGDLEDTDCLRDLFRSFSCDAVIHFASSIEVAESQIKPRKYVQNNLSNSLNLIHTMMDEGVSNLVFSSSAAVYGLPINEMVLETDPLIPINTYGRTKAMIEQVLDDYRKAYGFPSISLRYFNAAGADLEAELGERHHPETHLIPKLCMTAAGLHSEASIFGTNYDTEDGTCIRDFVHVEDLCKAHVLALNRLFGGSSGRSYNLGNGAGYSVKAVIESVKRVTGVDFAVAKCDKRPGDPERLVADATAAREELSWEPKISDLDDIVRSAWKFFQQTSSLSANR